MKHSRILLALLLTCVSVCSSATNDPDSKPIATPKYEPSNTQVAALPFIDESGRHSKESARWCANGLETCRTEFSKRGFQLLPGETINRILTDQKLDLYDDESRTRDRLKSAGQAMSADILVMAILRPLREGPGLRKWYGSTLEMRIMDVATGSYLVDGSFKASQGGSNLSSIPFIPLFTILDQANRSAPIREGAVSKAVSESLKSFLASYKPVVEITKPEPERPAKTNEADTTQKR